MSRKAPHESTAGTRRIGLFIAAALSPMAGGLIAALAGSLSAPVLIGASIALAWSVAFAALAIRQIMALEQDSFLDRLTGLPNRDHFSQQLNAAVSASHRFDTSTAVLMVDIDRFKDVNDTHGHQAGDELLRQVARRLADSLRPYDTIARYGGEEFSVVLPHADEAGAIAVAERLRRAVAERPFDVGRGINAFSATVSVGFAVFPLDSADTHDLVHYADLALYSCKHYGRNQLRRWFDDSHTSDIVARHREIIESLVETVHDRDGKPIADPTAARWSRQLAAALGLDRDSQDTVEAAMRIHDVGKVGVPDWILQKPGTLDEDEWKIIQSHPAWGSDIVSNADAMERIAMMIRQHQEWFDGRGYPQGLTGDAIEIGARILAVVDAFSAMITDRPYRPALTLDEALQELHRGAGSQFDPTCVEAFIALVKSAEVDLGDVPPLAA